MQDKKMYKVISPIERRDGTKWWMRCGSAHRNKDESMNVYVDALPLASLTPGKGITLQIREYTEQEMRERAERSAGNHRREGFGTNGLAMGAPPPAAYGGDGAGDSPPF